MFDHSSMVTRVRALSGRAWVIVIVELLVIAIAVADTAPWTGESTLAVTFGFISAAALALRRRLPLLTWALCVPAIATSVALVAPLVAVYSVARFTPSRWRVNFVVAGTFVANVYSAFQGDGVAGNASAAVLQTLVYCVLLSVGPAALGTTDAARNELGTKLAELVVSQQRERRLAAASAIAEERARLAREMHDVVSHQVSLIALQAGALRVTSKSPHTEDVARTIRRLAVDTLTELRVMVGVLRQGQDTDLTPQPRMADIARLVAASGLPAYLHDELPSARIWSEPVQRAAYRSIQEGLTNVHKHAPGARVDIHLCADAQGMTVSISNEPSPVSASRRPPPEEYPSGQHGLIGLRERAELLGGGVRVSKRDDGGYELVVRLTERQPAALMPPTAADGHRNPY